MQIYAIKFKFNIIETKNTPKSLEDLIKKQKFKNHIMLDEDSESVEPRRIQVSSITEGKYLEIALFSTLKNKLIPCFSGSGSISKKDISDGLGINFFVYNTETGRGVFSRYNNALSVNDFKRFINKLAKIHDYTPRNKDLIIPVYNREELETMMNKYIEEVKEIYILSDGHDFLEKSKTSEGGDFLDDESVEFVSVAKLSVTGEKKTKAISKWKKKKFWPKIFKVTGLDKLGRPISAETERKKIK